MIAALVLAALSAAAQVHHAIATTDAQAQALFDQGLLHLYAFSPQAAERSFAQALQRDPHAAMAAWGEALANGTDLNTHLTPQSFARAQAAAHTAQTLETYASAEERAYIDAVAQRYAGAWSDRDNDETLYIAAMKRLIAAYPNDGDAAMLYAEALMVRYGSQDAQARSLITALLARDPQNIFANHLCMHAYDIATDRTPAIACAERIDAMTFEPADEHLAHMPAHTYIETGNYTKALAASERAWRLRESWSQNGGDPLALKYAVHDAYVGWAAALMLGDRAVAQTWESRFNAAVGGGAPEWITAARFGDLPSLIEAQSELKSYGNTNGDEHSILQAIVAEREGRTSDAVAALQSALQYQTKNNEGEMLPLFPAGEALGSLYVRVGRYADARDAFQATLSRYPNDPRALYGLSQALAGLGQAMSSQSVLKRFEAIWNGPTLPSRADP